MGAEASGVLSRAAIFAVRAPSLHNSQPWHWYVGPDALDLRLEPERLLPTTDPDARLAILSCGVALHHARIHLAAGGKRVIVTRAPSPGDPNLLARIRLAGRTEADHDAMRMLGASARRHTDRRGSPGAPLDLHRVRSVGRAVNIEGAGFTVLRPRQVFALAEAAEHAQDIESADRRRLPRCGRRGRSRRRDLRPPRGRPADAGRPVGPVGLAGTGRPALSAGPSPDKAGGNGRRTS